MATPVSAVLLGELPHHQPVSPVPLCQIQSVRLVYACLFAWRGGKNNKRRSAVCGWRGGGLRHPSWALQLNWSHPKLPYTVVLGRTSMASAKTKKPIFHSALDAGASWRCVSASQGSCVLDGDTRCGMPACGCGDTWGQAGLRDGTGRICGPVSGWPAGSQQRGVTALAWARPWIPLQ